MTPSVDILLPAIAEGDEHAFGQLVVAAEPFVRSALRSFAAHLDVEAVVQETFLRVWQVAPRIVLDGRPNALLRFSMRVAKNLAVSELRRVHRGALPVDPATLESEDVFAEAHARPDTADHALRAHVLSCLEALPAQPRAALGLRLSADGTEHDRDLAARCRMTLNTFLQNVTRARKLVLACLESKGITRDEVLR